MNASNFIKTKLFYITLIFSVFVLNGFAQSSLSVDVGKADAIVNKEIFGGLMERLGRGVNGGVFVGTSGSNQTNGLRNDIIEGLKECGFGALQWPGGCAAQNYNWNPPNPSNDLGTDRFMQLCELTGCTPIITGRSNDTYSASNKAWVRYINDNPDHPDWYLKYFQIGNEVWGCGGNFGSWSAYKPSYNRNYDSLHIPVNDKPISTIAGTDGIWRYEQWLKDMMAEQANRIDNIEIHDYIYYPDDIHSLNFSDNDYYNILNLANEGQMRPRLDGIISILNRYDPDNRIKIWEGEWGNWLIDNGDQWQQYGTLMDALSAGETLNLFVKYAHRMLGAGLAQVINVIHSIMNTESANGPMVKTPTFYVFKCYIPHHTDNAKSAPFNLTSEKVSNIPAISAAATVNDFGHVNVSLTNIDMNQSKKVNITLANTEHAYICSLAQVVTGPAKNSYNHYNQTPEVELDTVPSICSKSGDKTFSITLPKMSIALVSLRPDPPLTSTVQPGTLVKKRREDAFSIHIGSYGKMHISSPLNRKAPITISLYSIDGKSLINSLPRTLEPGNNSCILKCTTIGKGAYIVKLRGTGVDFSKKIVVTK